MANREPVAYFTVNAHAIPLEQGYQIMTELERQFGGRIGGISLSRPRGGGHYYVAFTSWEVADRFEELHRDCTRAPVVRSAVPPPGTVLVEVPEELFRFILRTSQQFIDHMNPN